MEQGEPEDGITQWRHGIDGWRAVRGQALTPYFLGSLAAAYAQVGRADAALASVTEAVAVTEQTREGYMEAELHTLKGEFQSEPAEAETCFERAIEIARRQKAKSFELRAVLSLSRLYDKQGRQPEARQMLAETYGWFTEGFDTADLKEAAALLGRFDASDDALR